MHILTHANSNLYFAVLVYRMNARETSEEVRLLRSQLEDLLNCQICYGRATEPMMCPFCSKIYCKPCVTQCLNLKPECANCRQKIGGVTTMANCTRFINELVQLSDQLIERKNFEQTCKHHMLILSYYCSECSEPVCCECGMFGSHQGHSLIRIEQIYKAHYDCIRGLLSQFKIKVLRKDGLLKDAQKMTKQLEAVRKKQLNEIEEYSDKYKKAIELKPAEGVIKSEDFAKDYHEYIAEINVLEEELKQHCANAQTTCDYTMDPSFEERTKDVISRKKNKAQTASNASVYEVLPAYTHFVFVIPNFEVAKAKKEGISSPVQNVRGCEWSLRIYPNGNLDSKDEYLSIFLVLNSSLQEGGTFDYTIEIAHPSDPAFNYKKQYHSKFYNGESCGTNKFIKLKDLSTYLHGKDLKILFNVRASLYYDVCRQNASIIKVLSQEIQIQEQEIARLRSFLPPSRSNSSYSDL